jgi:hypothetical protein
MATITRAIPSTFNTTPANTDYISSGDDEIRNTRVDFRERLVNGGHVFGQTTNYAYDGRHACGAEGSNDQFIIYEADMNTPALIIDDSLKTISANTAEGWVINATAPAADNPTRRQIVWWMPATLTTGREPFQVVQMAKAGDLVECRVHVEESTPQNSSIKVEMLKCAAANNPTDGNFSNVLSTYAEIQTGQYKGATTNFVSTPFVDGDYFVPEVTQVGGAGVEGGNLTVTLILDM